MPSVPFLEGEVMAKFTVLSAEQIASALDLAEVEIDTKIDPRKLIRLLVVHGMVEPKLTLEIVSAKSYHVIERIAQEVMKLNGMQTEKGASPATVADVTFRPES